MKLVGSFHRISNTNILRRDHVVAFIVISFEVGWKNHETHSLTMKKFLKRKKDHEMSGSSSISVT